MVTFLARSTDKTKPNHQVPVKLSGVEFTRRWSLHILPKSFTRTRCYGGYSGRYRKNFIALCQQLRPQPTPAELPATASIPEPETEANVKAEAKTPCCPNCQQPMQLVRDTRRPSWRDLFYGPAHPTWFES
jgi:ribosomal protein L34E